MDSKPRESKKSKLSPLAYAVCFEKATEPPFSWQDETGSLKGVFCCANCGAALFDKETKFDSQSGWPSFTDPIQEQVLSYQQDTTLAEPRVEVCCKACGAHMGHVFPDGPLPGGTRYCINGVALAFKAKS